MKQIKKTILTLVALLAVTTQAWATDVYLVGNGDGNWLNGVGWDPGAAGNKMTEQNGVYSITFTNVAANSELPLQFKFAINGTWDMNYGCTSETEKELNKTLSNIDAFGNNIMFRLTETADVTISFNLSELTYMISTKGMKVGDDTPSGPEVAWDEAKKTGTFTMPGGNVTLEPEYYDLATLADNGLTAAEDAAAKTEAPLAVLAENAVTGGTLMYFVIYDENFSQADAIALAEDEWEAAIPTAETIEAAGTYYVWYYIKGDDEHSDTDPQRLAVTVLPEPTYAVEFAEGVNPEPPAEPKWTASPAAGVKKGETVTVTYTGQRKVMGVKAEKKAAAPSLNITNPEVGQVIGSDGKNYAYGSLPTGVTAVAKICYVSGSNGLALALTDEGYMDWSTAKTTCAAHTPAFTGGTWKLASNDEWDNMISAAGSYSALRDGFSSVGGTNMLSAGYWSSTESNAEGASFYFFDYGYWSEAYKDSEGNAVRACLAF